MHEPSRPFESLDWYREAQRGHDDEHPWLSRAQSFGAVRAHISLFAVGSVTLLAINLVRSPAHVWADTWIAVWALVLLMHAVATGIVALLMQLLAPDDLRPFSEVRWDPLRTWRLPAPGQEAPVLGPPTPAETEAAPQAVDAKETAPESEAPPAREPEAPAPPAPAATGWRAPTPEPAPPPASERASWEEVSAAAWLARRPHSRHDGGASAPPREPDAPASDNGTDDSASGRERAQGTPIDD